MGKLFSAGLIIFGLVLCVLSAMSSNYFIICMGIYYFLISLTKKKLNLYLLIIVCFGLGINLILYYRINVGVPINILDVLISALLVNMLTDKKGWEPKHKVSKDRHFLLVVVFIMLSCLALIRGIVSRYPMYNVIKDLRVFIYFIIVYYYSRMNIRSFDELKKVMKVVIFAGILVSFQVIYTFLSKGMQSDFSSDSARDVSLPVMTAILALLFLIVYFKETGFFMKHTFGYINLCLLFLLSVVLSLTRSIWISLLLVFIIYFLLIPRSEINVKKFAASLLIATLCITLAGTFSEQLENTKVTGLIFKRFNSALNMFANKKDTIAGRFDAADYAADHLGMKGIIFGQGFGSSMKLPAYLDVDEPEIVGLENSFLHYCWKLGIYGSVVVFLLFILKIMDILYVFKKNKTKKYSQILSALFSYTLVSFALGIFSQGINIAYVMPSWGILLGIDYKTIMDTLPEGERKGYRHH